MNLSVSTQTNSRMPYTLALILLLCSINNSYAQTGESGEKYRVIIMTDMTHDDGNSLIRYLYYTPFFDTEAIIVTPQLPAFNHDDPVPWNKVTNILTAYEKEYPHLKKHHAEFANPETLKMVTRKGRGALPIIWLTNEKKFASEIAGRYVESTWGDISFHDWIGEGRGNQPQWRIKRL